MRLRQITANVCSWRLLYCLLFDSGVFIIQVLNEMLLWVQERYVGTCHGVFVPVQMCFFVRECICRCPMLELIENLFCFELSRCQFVICCVGTASNALPFRHVNQWRQECIHASLPNSSLHMLNQCICTSKYLQSTAWFIAGIIADLAWCHGVKAPAVCGTASAAFRTQPQETFPCTVSTGRGRLGDVSAINY